jgi:rRNA maturation protein Nop10
MSAPVTRFTSETGWTFEPGPQAPMRGTCSRCVESAILLRPRVLGIDEGRYLLQAVCKQCGSDVFVSLG